MRLVAIIATAALSACASPPSSVSSASTPTRSYSYTETWCAANAAIVSVSRDARRRGESREDNLNNAMAFVLANDYPMTATDIVVAVDMGRDLASDREWNRLDRSGLSRVTFAACMEDGWAYTK